MEQVPNPIRAAQYVRMSTDRQVYSTANQKDAIGLYAALHGFEVVRTYTDEGRSGLTLKGRTALQQLLADVLGEAPGFGAILVYDVSRWGRFQDTDESAHYEFICRSAGVPIHYCAETFSNDGSMPSTIMKTLKRVMAGEFSRELSEKVYAGCARLAAKGYKMGGVPPYGLHRQLVDENDNPKGVLGPGQQKNLRTDHVRLVPGEAHEVAVVRKIFRLCIRRRWTTKMIAAALNKEGLTRQSGDKWTAVAIGKILRNEIYAGISIYGRDSKKLGGRQLRNDPSKWIVTELDAPALIDIKTFKAARRVMADNRWEKSDEQLLGMLRDLYERTGWLSVRAVLKTVGMPTPTTYRLRFGSFTKACRMVGFVRPSLAYTFVNPTLLERACYLFDVTHQMLAAQGARVEVNELDRTVMVDGQTVLGVGVVRPMRANSRGRNWRIRLKPGRDIDGLVVELLADRMERPLGYVLLPASRFGSFHDAYVTDVGSRVENIRFDRIDQLYPMLRQAMP